MHVQKDSKFETPTPMRLAPLIHFYKSLCA